jgi:hypothetical protein
VPAPVSLWELHGPASTTAADAPDAEGAHPASGQHTNWCEFGDCAFFNGVNSAFTTAGPVLNTGSGTSFTVAAWVNLKSIPPGNLFATVASQNGDHASAFFLQYSGVDKRWAFSRVANDNLASTNPAYRALSNAAPVLHTWTYLVGVFNGSTDQMVLYVNGVAQNDAVTDPTPFAGRGDFVIGRALYRGKVTDWFNGDLRDVAAFNQALSGAQVSKLFKASGG